MIDMPALLDGMTTEQKARVSRAINAAMAATLAATKQAAAYQDQVIAAQRQTLESQQQTREIVAALYTIVMASYTSGDATPLHETLLPILRVAMETTA